jgi:mRNA interferase HicA
VTGGEFLRRLKSLARRSGVAFEFIPDRGKGSPGRACYGKRFTTVKNRRKEIGSGLFSDMCKQLGINPRDLQ